ncbi:MAG: mercury resistance system transport protein MerF [Vicinamibacterales bacterium]
MDNRTLLRTGIAGTVVAALCCATPVLVVLLGAVGLSAWIGGLDYVLIPALVAFLGLTTYALRRRRVEAACCTVPDHAQAGTPGGRP